MKECFDKEVGMNVKTLTRIIFDELSVQMILERDTGYTVVLSSGYQFSPAMELAEFKQLIGMK